MLFVVSIASRTCVVTGTGAASIGRHRDPPRRRARSSRCCCVRSRRSSGEITNRIARGVGDIAVLHLAKERSRSAYTLALIMVVMAMLFATGGLFLSVRAAHRRPRRPAVRRRPLRRAERPRRRLARAEAREARDDVEIASRRCASDSRRRLRQGDEAKRSSSGRSSRRSYFAVSSYLLERRRRRRRARRRSNAGGTILVSTDVATRLRSRASATSSRSRRPKGDKPFDDRRQLTAPHPGPPEITMGIKDAQQYLTADRPLGYIVNVDRGRGSARSSQRGSRRTLRKLRAATPRRQPRTRKKRANEIAHVLPDHLRDPAHRRDRRTARAGEHARDVGPASVPRDRHPARDRRHAVADRGGWSSSSRRRWA